MPVRLANQITMVTGLVEAFYFVAGQGLSLERVANVLKSGPMVSDV